MRRLMDLLLIWRSFPCIIAYLFSSKETKSAIVEDLKRYNCYKGVISLHSTLLNSLVFRRQFYVRIFYESRILYYICRYCYRPLFSLELSATSGEIGAGLQIIHGYSTIICCKSMGENCTVYQNVTIGKGKSIDGNDVPIIGDNVTVYAGAIIVGGIHIGDNSVIGAGAVVVKDVPAGATVVGQPIRVLSRGG